MKNFSTQFNPQSPEVENPNIQEEKAEQHIEEERARCDWEFNLSTVVTSSSTGASTDTIGVIEFDPSDNLVATGGIARKIRVYSRKVTWLQHNDACDYYVCTPAKLSSLRWKPGSAGRVLGSGDYDGVVTEYDLDQKIPIFERDEHGTDGCLRLWSMHDARMIRVYMGHMNTRSFVGLSVWRTGGLLGCGSENNHVFVYDKRWGEPIWVHEFGVGSRDGRDPNFVSSVCWRQVGGEDGCTLGHLFWFLFFFFVGMLTKFFLCGCIILYKYWCCLFWYLASATS
ncbi:unnamed protein product, partial [Vitis vinifera]